MYKLIEKSMIGKVSDAKCEDGYFISDHLIAVVDGGTPKGKIKWNQGQTSGWFAKELILEALKSVDPNWTNKKILEHINSFLNKQYKKDEHFFYYHPEEQLQAGIVYYNDLRKEIVSYGDCPILINNDYFEHGKFIDVLSTGLRSFYLRLVDLKAININEKERQEFARNSILDFLTMQSFFSNLDRPFGFPVLNGLKLNHKLTIVHKIKSNDMVVLASDGYIKLLPTLKASETYLKKYLEKDPECYQEFMAAKGKLPGNKSFDDRTYLRFKVIA